jgi:ATP adenylyltransferase
MRYVGGDSAETGCIFCNRLAADNDVDALILYRAPLSFAIMNLFPYNTGHIMLVPNEHVASPEDASLDALSEIATLLPKVLRALRRVLSCHGFNIGLNVGSVAGAGVAEHLHQHVVPRWNGDANFMPILANTTVMPELIPVTYAKLRAELQREIGAESTPEVYWVLLDPRRERVWLESGARLSLVQPESDTPIWRTVIDAAARAGIRAAVAGWAGASRSNAEEATALTLVADEESDTINSFVPVEEAPAKLTSGDRQLLAQALQNQK